MSTGIIECTDWSSAFCIEKAVELGVSSVVLLFAFIQMIVHICYEQERCSIKSKYIIMCSMILSLLSNCMHCMYHQIVEFLYFQTLFFNIYFLTIVYYTFLKLLEKYNKSDSCTLATLRITYAFLIIFYIAVLISSMVIPARKCEQVWYLAVRCLGLFLAVLLITFGFLNHNKEKDRLLAFSALKTYKNPFPALWIWIGTNTTAQLCNVIQSLVFTIDTELECKFSTNGATNFIISFVMLWLTYYIALIPTLWIFWVPICRPKEVVSPRPSEDYYEIQYSGIQIMQRSSSSNIASNPKS